MQVNAIMEFIKREQWPPLTLRATLSVGGKRPQQKRKIIPIGGINIVFIFNSWKSEFISHQEIAISDNEFLS